MIRTDKVASVQLYMGFHWRLDTEEVGTLPDLNGLAHTKY
jgi:hypothetical protein